MLSRHRAHAALALALWAAPLTMAGVTRRAARRAAERQSLIRVGMWAGAAVERERCTMMHDPYAIAGHPAPGAQRTRDEAVDSGACPVTPRDV